MLTSVLSMIRADDVRATAKKNTILKQKQSYYKTIVDECQSNGLTSE